MKYEICNRQEKIIYRFLMLTLIISGINGVLIDKLHIKNTPIGIIYRSLLMVYFLYLYIKIKKENIVRVTFIIMIMVIGIAYVYFMYTGNWKSLGFDFEQYLRLVLSLIIAVTLIGLVRKNIINGGLIYKIMYDSTKVLIWIYIIGLVFKIGSSTYGQAGYKSVFNANNGLNITVIVLFIFQMERAFKHKKKQDYIYSLILIVILILLGSKSSFIFVGFYFVLRVIFEKNIFKLIKMLMLILVVIGVVYWVIRNIFYNQFLSIIERQMYFFQKENSANSLITFFLSGRNILLKAGMQYAKHNMNILSVILGFGNYNIQTHIGNALGFYSLKNIEMDFFDILLGNGVIGIIMSYGYSMKLFISNIRRLFFQKKYAVIISFICMIIFSFTGGHVYTDSMGSTFLGLVLVLLVEKNSVEEIR